MKSTVIRMRFFAAGRYLSVDCYHPISILIRRNRELMVVVIDGKQPF
jgi:hypothetical protein